MTFFRALYHALRVCLVAAVFATTVSCRAQTQQVSQADTSTGETVRQDEKRPVPEFPDGDFRWPRLLGETFDGTGQIGTNELVWEQEPVVAWRLPVGEGYGLGSVVNRTYYHFDAAESEDDNGQVTQVERLRAFDLIDGTVKWTSKRPFRYGDMYGYEAGPRGTPTVAGDKIYTLGVTGDLCCRSITNGDLIWSVDTNEKYGVVKNFFGVGASPLILEDKIIVHVGGSPPEDQEIPPGQLQRVISNGTCLVAFALEDGKELWRSGEDLASYSSPRSFELGGKQAVLQFARDFLIGFDADSGDVLWKYRHRADIRESVNAMIPVVNEDQVFISECYQVGSVLLKVDTESAEPLWKDPDRDRRAQAMRCHWSTPILIDGYLYGCSGRNNPDSSLRCVEWATGKVQWSDDRRVRSSVTRAGDHLIVWNENGKMQIIKPSPDELKVVAEYNFQSLVRTPCWAAPIVVGNRLIVRGDNHVLCLAVATK